jgi:hypothetical protein
MPFKLFTLTNGQTVYVNTDHIMFIGPVVHDNVPTVNQTALKMIDGFYVVEGNPKAVADEIRGIV